MVLDGLPYRAPQIGIRDCAQLPTQSSLGDGPNLVSHDDGLQWLAGGVRWQEYFGRIEPSLGRREWKNGGIRDGAIELVVAHYEHGTSSTLLRSHDGFKVCLHQRPLRCRHSTQTRQRLGIGGAKGHFDLLEILQKERILTGLFPKKGSLGSTEPV